MQLAMQQSMQEYIQQLQASQQLPDDRASYEPQENISKARIKRVEQSPAASSKFVSNKCTKKKDSKDTKDAKHSAAAADLKAANEKVAALTGKP